MTADIRDFRIHQHLVRAVTALCAFAAACGDEDARGELTDDAAFAVHIWTSAAGDARIGDLRDWCGQTAVTLERMRGPGREHRALLRAAVALLRLRAALPVPEKPAPVKSAPRKEVARKEPVPRPASLGANQRRLLDALRTTGPIRTRDLIAHLAGQLSDRTVKRSLKELAAAGLIRRTESGGAVTYEVVAE